MVRSWDGPHLTFRKFKRIFVTPKYVLPLLKMLEWKPSWLKNWDVIVDFWPNGFCDDRNPLALLFPPLKGTNYLSGIRKHFLIILALSTNSAPSIVSLVNSVTMAWSSAKCIILEFFAHLRQPWVDAKTEWFSHLRDHCCQEGINTGFL